MPTRRLKEETELFYAFLRQNGLKKTYQKDLILDTFLSTEGHLSVEDIYSLVRKKDKKVGVVTVFRTLKSLVACGIAREITLGDGLTRFEHSYHHPHHHHIICTDCHKAIEYVSPALERIQDEIIHRYRFQPIAYRFQTYGICAECQDRQPVAEPVRYDTEKVFARDALQMAICMENRGLDFYRLAARRNQDSAGRETLEQIIRQQEAHLNNLQADLDELNRQEKGLDRVPIFLHFDPCELEKLVPDLRDYERDGILQLDSHAALEIAMMHEQRAAGFFKEFAERFKETHAKRIFQRFAEEEMNHFQTVIRRVEKTATAG
jgi:Fur family transcriptional regulator, ferric uptake regulator